MKLMIKASWDDVVLNDTLKRAIQNDYRSFFKSEDIYKKLNVPWKRGLIFLGVSQNSLPLRSLQKADLLTDSVAPGKWENYKSKGHYERSPGPASLCQIFPQ